MDLRLANQISYFKEGLPLDINLSRGNFAKLFSPLSESFKISEGQPFVLRPNHLVLGRTLERVELPIVANGQSLAARVEGKSSYARCGLLVHLIVEAVLGTPFRNDSQFQGQSQPGGNHT